MVQRALARVLPAPADAGQPSRLAGFEDLFAAHAGAVFAYARRRTTREAADDVVAETFLVAWRRCTEIPDNARPWLLGVARNVLANQRRADGRRAQLADRLSHLTAVTAPDAAQLPVGNAAVVAALAQLPPTEREVLELLAWDGLTPSEAAVALDIPRATVYVRLHRARRRLSRRPWEEQ